MNVAMHIHDNAENITPVLDDSRPPSKADMIFLRQNVRNEKRQDVSRSPEGARGCPSPAPSVIGSWPGRPRTRKVKIVHRGASLHAVASGHSSQCYRPSDPRGHLRKSVKLSQGARLMSGTRACCIFLATYLLALTACPVTSPDGSALSHRYSSPSAAPATSGAPATPS